ncbi:alpha/beta hydrolase [Paenibacillus segetis]|uniref:Alpha/beta hydrolase n=1 Tax=Paenibacillus segetis TaxID=1325360 RepID=A0ABQ1Y5S5_9BACL|nr:alpha/beta hydrolase [Paenibacillus segetis]GGH13706.1 alpha/beta hydrolase [Paenibacillus segetis]
MREENFTFQNDAGQQVFVYHWTSEDESIPVRGVVQIAHGMTETAKRYERFASELTQQGFQVYANDHRGHGKTAQNSEELGYPGKDGFNGMVRDIVKLGDIIKEQHPNLPLFLLGHSMGSFLTQKTMYAGQQNYIGFILTGTNGPQGLLHMGQNLARFQGMLQGERHPSLMLNALTFGSFNKNFLPVRTKFDWLSRDPAEVDKYIDDPFCGFLCSASFFQDFFTLLLEIHRPNNMAKISKQKSVYIFGGDKDPVGKNGTGVQRLVDIYKRLQIQDLELKMYPGGRHEMLNETNRDEVTADVVDWLVRHTK